MTYDLVIRGGLLVTASDRFIADIGVAAGRIAALGVDLEGRDEIDARGLLVLPGGVDAHCHLDEPAYLNAQNSDDFHSASRSAACGGTTTIVPFANQLKGKSLREAVADYHRRAEGNSLIDYAFHLILKEPNDSILGQELPALIEDGYSSLKVFMRYDGYALDDRQLLQVFAVTKRHGGLVMVHAENGHCIHYLGDKLEAEGRVGLDSHIHTAPAVVEREATHRAIALAETVGTRLLLVHVSSADAMDQIAWAQARGLPVLAETCPQYLTITEDHLKLPGWEAARYLFSPPPRDAANAERLWRGLANGTFQLLSSDHSPYDLLSGKGKKSGGEAIHFRKVPPGVPGLETRLPILFHEGVNSGRLTLEQFVALTATNPARIYGLYPRKGTLAVGADADLVLWDPNKEVTIRQADLHHACDFTPFEGWQVRGWPLVTLSRGERVWDRGWVSADHGRGRFLPRKPLLGNGAPAALP